MQPEPISTTKIVYCPFDGPLGSMLLAAQGDALVSAWFDGQRHQPRTSAWHLEPTHPILLQAKSELQQYFAGVQQAFTVRLQPLGGTTFQQRVWQSLLTIVPGQISTYGTICAQLGQPRAMRAVGGAIGRNPISILIPCHRVLGASGALTGYAGGLDRKAALLQLESRY
jgi:methylated-DNA-[protein]-cysteine S-methyltransferase